MSFLFAYFLLYGLPGKIKLTCERHKLIRIFPDYYRQAPPKVPGFLKTLFRRKLVSWFLFSTILRDYWLSGVRAITVLPDLFC
jgi:alpha-1,3-glucan synthase